MKILISQSLIHTITAKEIIEIWNKEDIQYFVRDNKILKLEKFRGTLRCSYVDEEVDLWNLFII